jgi:ferritin
LLIVLFSIRILIFFEIQKPQQQSWNSPLEAHETALQLEKDVYQALLELHASATNHKYDISSILILIKPFFFLF